LFVDFSTGWLVPLLALFANSHSNFTPASNCQYGLCLSKTPGNEVDEIIPGPSVKNVSMAKRQYIFYYMDNIVAFMDF